MGFWRVHCKWGRGFLKPKLHSIQGRSTCGREAAMQSKFYWWGEGMWEREVRTGTVSKDRAGTSNPLSCILRWLAVRMRKVRGQGHWVLCPLSKAHGESRGLHMWTGDSLEMSQDRWLEKQGCWAKVTVQLGGWARDTWMLISLFGLGKCSKFKRYRRIYFPVLPVSGIVF